MTNIYTQPGLSLRTTIAVLALQGTMVNVYSIEDHVKRAYQYADEFLKYEMGYKDLETASGS